MRPLAIDCGAGAGGLSLGLHAAGWRTIGIECDGDATETHNREVGPCICARLEDVASLPKAPLVASGIPCQSFSAAGLHGGTADPRGRVYLDVMRIASMVGARALLLENVRGLTWTRNAEGITGLREILSALERDGWIVTHQTLNAADYGVPQNRYRVFLVAFRSLADRARGAPRVPAGVCFRRKQRRASIVKWGNAVPPAFGEALGRAILNAIC